MLQYDPASRLSIADLAAHPWVQNGHVASLAEINNDFTKRRQNIAKEQKAEVAK